MYTIAIFIGLGLAAVGLALYVGAAGWRHVWAWIDDSEPDTHNPIARLIMEFTGWDWQPNNAFSTPEEREKYGQWHKGSKKKYKWEFAFDCFPYFLLVIPLPAILLFLLIHFVIPLAIITLAAIMFIARFVRRHKKLFDKHMADPDAHKTA